MLGVIRNAAALLFGMFLLLVGNGLHGTLLGVRGAIEGFDAATMSIITTCYFIGFLFGSRATPYLIRRVGHVRVFAALASFISAGFILFPAAPDPIAWSAIRLMVGFCFSGVYVVAESWLNNAASNETRGQTLSLYMIVQFAGLIAAQGILNFADAAGYTLFIIISVLVSISFAPILLSVSPAPYAEATKPMSLRQLYGISPFGCVSAIALGAIFSAMFGMGAVYGTERGLSVADISLFVALIFAGGLLLQFPIGWLSDRMDRRRLITVIFFLGALTCLVGVTMADGRLVLMTVAFLIGAFANPLYSLVIAYTNDFIELEDMAAAASGLVFLNGLGAIGGPVAVGWLMETFSASAYFAFLGTAFALMALYGLYRMTRRPAPSVAETSSYPPVLASSSPYAVEAAQEVAIEMAREAAEGEEEREVSQTQPLVS
ncbi:MAG: MFS transporter [Pseudomonadota bacterium]